MSDDQILYNLTFQISPDYISRWLSIAKDISSTLVDGEIIKAVQINEIEPHEKDLGNSYAMQFWFGSHSLFEQNKLSKMRILLEKIDSEMRGQYAYFETKMRVLHYYSK